MINFLLDFIFPVFCQSCFAEGSYLCLVCQNKIDTTEQRCAVCGRASLLGLTHVNCASAHTALKGLLVASDYQNQAVRDLIWNLKYNGVQGIAGVLATIISDCLVKHDLLDYFSDSIIVPVPLHKKRQRLRGFNQAELLARELARRLNLECCLVLKKTKPTARQVELEKDQRLLNLVGSFEADALTSLSNKKIILVDDVAATGATLEECARALKTLNPREIWGLVVARGA